MSTSVCTLGGGAACPAVLFLSNLWFLFCPPSSLRVARLCSVSEDRFSILGSFSSLSNRKRRMTRVPKLLNCLPHTSRLTTKCVLLWLLGTHVCLSSASPPLHFSLPARSPGEHPPFIPVINIQTRSSTCPPPPSPLSPYLSFSSHGSALLPRPLRLRP